MIHFECVECGENLEAPLSMTGEVIECPRCGSKETVPVEGGQPIATPKPVDTPIKVDLEDEVPITLEGNDDEGPMRSSQIRTFDMGSSLEKRKESWKRPTNMDNKGATRVRNFHTKLTDNAMRYLDDEINEWIDANPDVEVKFSNTTVGPVEGKKIENHLIITLWY